MNKSLIFAAALSVMIFGSTCNAAIEWSNASVENTCNLQMHGLASVTIDSTTYLYSLGGNIYGGEGDTNKIFYTALDNHGQPTVWNTSAKTLTTPIVMNAYLERATFTKGNNIFVVGGDTNGSGSGSNRYQVVKIGSDGDVSSVTATDITGSYAYTYADSIAFDPENNRVYAVKRSDGSVHMATVMSDSLSAFSSASVKGTIGRYFAPVVFKDGYLYWIGGGTSANRFNSTDIFTLGTDGMPTAVRTATALLPNTLIDGSGFVYRGNLYTGGGCISSNADTQTAFYKGTIDASGDLTAWTKDSDLTLAVRRQPACVVNDEYIYVSGGRCAQSVYSKKLQIGKAPTVAPASATVTSGTDNTVICELKERQASLSLNPSTGGKLTIDWARGSSFIAPDAFKQKDDLYKESLTITNDGVTGFNATLTWVLDPMLIPTSGINTAFRVVGGEIVDQKPVSLVNNTATVTDITDFSDWYLGNATAVPVGLSGIVLE